MRKSLESLAREYRATMPADVLHDWAKEVVDVINGTASNDTARYDARKKSNSESIAEAMRPLHSASTMDIDHKVYLWGDSDNTGHATLVARTGYVWVDADNGYADFVNPKYITAQDPEAFADDLAHAAREF